MEYKSRIEYALNIMPRLVETAFARDPLPKPGARQAPAGKGQALALASSPQAAASQQTAASGSLVSGPLLQAVIPGEAGATSFSINLVNTPAASPAPSLEVRVWGWD